MDWNAAIERHREALKRVLAALVAMAGFDGALTSPLRGGRREASGGGDDGAITPTRWSDAHRPPLKGEVEPALTLPRHLHRAVLRLLRPAEAAVRRLVIVAARDMPPLSSPPGERVSSRFAEGKSVGARWKAGERRDAAQRRGPGRNESLALPYPARIALPLFDPLRRTTPSRRASTAFPRISIPGWSEPAPLPVPPTPYDPIDARRLTLRLAALARALDDLPREARRFARWRSRSESLSSLRGSEGRTRQATRPERGGGGSGVRRLSPLRGGAPPGQPSRRRQTHEIHRILDDVHGLAFWALEAPDTS